MQPLPVWIVQERVAQAEHARLLPPAGDPLARVQPVQGQRAHDSKAAGIGLDSLEGHVGRAWIPAWRMDDGRIDAALVHQCDGFRRSKGRDLTVREIAWQAAPPEMDLGIDDLHGVVPSVLLRVGGVPRTVRSGCWRLSRWLSAARRAVRPQPDRRTSGGYACARRQADCFDQWPDLALRSVSARSSISTIRSHSARVITSGGQSVIVLL